MMLKLVKLFCLNVQNGTDTWSLDSLELHYTNAEELGFVDPRCKFS